jgi:hypothetical protein
MTPTALEALPRTTMVCLQFSRTRASCGDINKMMFSHYQRCTPGDTRPLRVLWSLAGEAASPLIGAKGESITSTPRGPQTWPITPSVPLDPGSASSPTRKHRCSRKVSQSNRTLRAAHHRHRRCGNRPQTLGTNDSPNECDEQCNSIELDIISNPPAHPSLTRSPKCQQKFTTPRLSTVVTHWRRRLLQGLPALPW